MYTNQPQQPAYGHVVQGVPQGYYGQGGYPQQQQQQQQPLPAYYQQQQPQPAYYQQQQQQQQPYYPPPQQCYQPQPQPQQQQQLQQQPPQGGYYYGDNSGASKPAGKTVDPACPSATYYAPQTPQPYPITQGVPLYEEFTHTPGSNTGSSLTGAGEGGRKFVVQGYKDVWAAVLFILFSIGIVGAGSYYFKTQLMKEIRIDGKHGTHDGNFHARDALVYSGVGVGSGFLLGILSLAIFYCAPRVSIVGANVLIILIFLTIAGFFARFGQIYGCVAFCLVAFARGLILYVYRRFIPMSSLFLKQSSVLAKRYPMATVFSFVTLLVGALWCVLTFSASYPVLSTTIHGYSKGSSSSTIAMWIFLVFGCYWSTQVAFNVGHTTFCGITATWYFCGERSMPSNPTLHSAKRAMSTSFGSIVLGSLLVAIVRAIRALLRSFGSQRSFCGCIAMCLLSCIEGILRLFNHFAYVYVAMYGCSYFEGAKRTMDLIKESRYMPLIGNLLIDGTLMMFELVLSCTVGGAALIVSRQKRYNKTGDTRWTGDVIVYALFAFATCFITLVQMFRVVDSTTTTLLVCLSEEPQMIFQTNPDFGGELAEQTNFAEVEAQAAAARDAQSNQSMASRV